MLEYWLWLSGRRGLGVRGLRALLEQFGTPEAVYCASDAEYPSDIRPDGRTSLADKELAPARQILQQCYRQCIHIVTLQDAVYPQRLKNIDDAPLVLYYQGVLPDFDAEPVIAMVGTRRASAYGLLQAKRLGYELGRYGAIVVSGGAAGIDTLALRGAVSSGTPPVAVFACGVDVDYPAANRSLFEDLRTNGCVMSELPPGTPPLPEHFPSRNRILSGLALGSVVVEAPEKSGALITANTALEQGRDVFAVPGPIDAPMSRGCNRLIADGAAALITDSWDVLREYEQMFPGKLSDGRSREAMERAELVIAVVDGGGDVTDEDMEIIRAAERARKGLVVLSKADLGHVCPPPETKLPCVTVSSVTGQGLDELEAAIKALFPLPQVPAGEILTNARQAEAISRALESMDAAFAAMRDGCTPDIVLTETEEAMSAIMSEEKKSDMDKVTLRSDTLRRYFPKSYTPKQMEQTIIKLLDVWQKQRQKNQER